jgi:hypothetical protein
MRFLKSSALALALGAASAVAVYPTLSPAQVSVGISVGFAPPPLPIYAQPPIPGPGYMWTPGYWAWDEGIGDYYWVPGVWVLAPQVGLLWTPAWWGWNDGVYLFHAGYWGPQVGFYGGIAYGYGYDGVGYGGGYWNAGHFFYNSAVNNVAHVTNVTNIYNRPVSANRSTVSFNGPGGVQARATQQQLAAANARHMGPTAQQTQQIRMAAQDPALRASRNKGSPPIAATARAGAFHDSHVVPASRPGGAWNAPAGQARRAETGGPAAARTGAEGTRTSGSLAREGRPGGREPMAKSADSAGAASAYVGSEHRSHQRDVTQGGPGASMRYERPSQHNAPRNEGAYGGGGPGGGSGYERHAPPMSAGPPYERSRNAGAYGPGPYGERSRSEAPMSSRPPHEPSPGFQQGPERQGGPPQERHRQQPGG